MPPTHGLCSTTSQNLICDRSSSVIVVRRLKEAVQVIEAVPAGIPSFAWVLNEFCFALQLLCCLQVRLQRAILFDMLLYSATTTSR